MDFEWNERERCENCIFFHMLKHNFERGKGFQHSHCCTVWVEYDLARGEYSDATWIQQVSPDGMCEMFCDKEKAND